MNSFKSAAAAVVIGMSGFVASSASASGISIETFSPAKFAELTSGAFTTIQDFETLHDTANFVSGDEGELTGPLVTNVGTFSSLGGSGAGGTCKSNSLAATCTQIALENDEIFGQGNLIPDDGEWSLSSNDTLGVKWVASLGGSLFDTIVFALRDAADKEGITLTVSATGLGSEVFGPAANDNKQLVVIKFASSVSEATIDLLNSANNPNDSFTIDGASISVVPLPASALLLLGGVGALGAMRRRKKA